jgi:hypothetical protein
MTEIADTGPLRPAHVRLLKIAVIVMGILILMGIVAVVARIVYLVSPSSRQPALSGASPASGQRLALPPGAVVRQVALSGDRLAVHYDGPEGPGIAVIDILTGSTVGRITIVPEPPR